SIQHLRRDVFDARFIALPFLLPPEQDGNGTLQNAAETVRLSLAGLAVSDERAKAAPEQIKRMIKADVEAGRFIRSDKEATVRVMMRWLGLEQSVAVCPTICCFPPLVFTMRAFSAR